MKLTSLVFLVVLVFAHGTGVPSELLGLPLSLFREGPGALFGYILFGLLLVISALMIHALLRCRLPHHAGLFGLAALLLLFVAATPSANKFHLLASFVLFAVLYFYYAALLGVARTAWLWVHLTIPALLVLATQCHSYGLWQKSFIVYFLLAANVHQHWLRRGPVLRPAQALGRHSSGGWRPRRRMVYTVVPSRSWARERCGKKDGNACPSATRERNR
jgi:hypothetical protein